MNKILLPKLEKISLSHFSLFTGKPNISLEFEKHCFCLAGANGLGKSTFLNCILYGITGIVRPGDYVFKSIEDFVKANQKYAKSYFEGRIQESDREFAEIEVGLQFNEVVLKVRRDFIDVGQVSEWYTEPNLPALQNLSRDSSGYEKAVEQLSGVDFNQFSFLCHYLLNFDEGRQLVFWNSSVLTRMLFLVFGLDPQMASDADSIARQIDRVDSRVRNLQWDITKTRTYIKNLQQDLNAMDDSGAFEAVNSIEERCKDLQENLSNNKKMFTEHRNRTNLLSAKISEMTAKKYSLRNQYELEYKFLFKKDRRTYLKDNSLVQEILISHKCGLCGSDEGHVEDDVVNAISSETCPLCSSNLADNTNGGTDPQALERLQTMDQELVKAEIDLNEALSERDRIEQELKNISQNIDVLQLQISEIESDPVYVDWQKANRTEEKRISINNIVTAQLERINSIARDKDIALRERNKLVKEAQQLQDKLRQVYNETQSNFLPIFQAFAQKFTGLPVTIHVDAIQREKKPEITFSLEIGESTRQFEHQLSESQKFFIDIALRMALILYLSGEDKEHPTVMLIDTPEGSLDIAYETNAGEMFAEFVKQSQQLILTANINSSGLVRALAKSCGKSLFEMHRMIDWANLSDVQLSHIPLFEGALDEIEKQMEE